MNIVGEIKVNQLSIYRDPKDPGTALYTIIDTPITDVFYNETKLELSPFNDQLKVMETMYSGDVITTYFITIIDIIEFTVEGDTLVKLIVRGKRLQTDEKEIPMLPIVPNDIVSIGNILIVRYPYCGDEDSKQVKELSAKYDVISFNNRLYYCQFRSYTSYRCSDNSPIDLVNVNHIAIYTITKIPSIKDLEDVLACNLANCDIRYDYYNQNIFFECYEKAIRQLIMTLKDK